MRYRERLHPAAWVWAMAVFVGVGLGISVWPVGARAGMVTAVGACAVLVILLVRSTPEVAVGQGRLRAGRAVISVALIGEVEVLDADRMRRAHGPELDARAYLCLRGWIPTGVLVPLLDPQDPTPYWLISSRHPDRLARALAGEREAGEGAERT